MCHCAVPLALIDGPSWVYIEEQAVWPMCHYLWVMTRQKAAQAEQSVRVSNKSVKKRNEISRIYSKYVQTNYACPWQTQRIHKIKEKNKNNFSELRRRYQTAN